MNPFGQMIIRSVEALLNPPRLLALDAGCRRTIRASDLSDPDSSLVRRELERVNHAFGVFLRRDTAISNGRAATPQVSYENVSRWATKCGVTRLGETTGLDRVGIPTFYAIRPSALQPSAVVSSGKGTSREAAMLSALFEAEERWAAESTVGSAFVFSTEELETCCPDVRQCAPPELAANERIPWVAGYDLAAGYPCFVPQQAVVFPYVGEEIRSCEIRNTTNGLASGTDPVEAMASAVLELIERDAVRRLDTGQLRRVEPASLGPEVGSMAARFVSHRVEVSLCWCSSQTGIPVFYCLTRDDWTGLSVFFCSGSGAHFTTNRAAIRALTEAGQSRAGFISSLREDVSRRVEAFSNVSYEDRRRHLALWFDTPEAAMPATEMPESPQTLWRKLKSLVERIQRLDPDTQVVAVEMRPFPGIFTFRIVCPTMLSLGPPEDPLPERWAFRE